MIVLTLLCFTIFCASYGFGSIPLYLPLSENAVVHLSLSGTGVLIASALAIIIPEGAEAVLSAHTGTSGSAELPKSNAGHYLGLAIVAGFAVMFLIDQTSSHGHSSMESSTSYVSVGDLQELHHFGNVEQGISSKPGSQLQSSISTTLGLCIHSLTDGIALGASAQSSISVSTVVFFAILLHKGPAAFALVSVLLKHRLARRTLQLHLLAFSLAAPLAALATYALIFWSGAGSSSETEAARTGLLLLFSGGTFLYVAVSHFPREHLTGPKFLSLFSGLIVPAVISILMSHSH